MRTLKPSTFKVISAIFLLCALGFTWGSGYALARFAMTHDVSPLGYAFWQSFGPALLLASAASVNSGWRWCSRRYWPFFFSCGLFGIVIPNTNMYFTASHLPAGVLAVLVNTVPIIVYPLALLAKQESFDPWRLSALLVGLCGIMLIVAPSSIDVPSHWALLALISPLMFALCSIYIADQKEGTLTALQAASGMLVAASILLTPLVLQQKAFYPLSLPLTTSMKVILLEIVLSSIGYLLFFKLICLAGAVFYSLAGAVVALTGIFWGIFLFSEEPTPTQIFASVLITLAILAMSWRQKKQQENENAQPTCPTIYRTLSNF